MILKMRIDRCKIEKVRQACLVLATLAVAVLAIGFGTPSFAADSIKGRQMYSTNCAACHGQNGRSLIPGAPNFDRGEAMLRPDHALLSSIKGGRNAMPAFQGILTDRDILDVIAYLRTLH